MTPAPRLLLLAGLWALLALPLLVIPGMLAVALWWALGGLALVIALLDLWHARRLPAPQAHRELQAAVLDADHAQSSSVPIPPRRLLLPVAARQVAHSVQGLPQ